MLFTAIVFMPFLLKAMPAITGTEWLYLGVIGIVHQFIAVIFHLKGLKQLKATTVAILGYTEPVFAGILAWIFLSESIEISALVGGTLILASSYLTIAQGLKTKQIGETNNGLRAKAKWTFERSENGNNQNLHICKHCSR